MCVYIHILGWYPSKFIYIDVYVCHFYFFFFFFSPFFLFYGFRLVRAMMTRGMNIDDDDDATINFLQLFLTLLNSRWSHVFFLLH